jgi:subtilisin family serine protease
MAGVRWLVEVAGCRVVNLSLGGGARSEIEESFYQQMRDKGVLIVCAAGNDGRRRLSYPARYASNIAVGAVDQEDTLAGFSNRGENLDVVAPGVGVLSAVPRGQGIDAAVTTDTEFGAGPLEYAGLTEGASGTLVECGLGRPGEFPAGVAGNIALIRRGEITFAAKVTNAMDAGAAGVIVFNNVAGGFQGTLGAATTSDGRAWIPAIAVSDLTGAKLLGQVGAGATLRNRTTDWDVYNGTSMAAPHVTGVIALIWSAAPDLPHTAVEELLLRTCTDLGTAGYDSTYGWGLVNADLALTPPAREGGGEEAGNSGSVGAMPE